MKRGEFRAVIATTNVVDKDQDLTLPGAFGEQQIRVSAYGHGSWGDGLGALPVGRGRLYEQDDSAIAEGQFFLDTQAGLETYRTVKNMGDLQEWSYALPEIDYEYRDIDGERVRVLKRIVVPEVSPVLIGAGIGTRTLEIKRIDDRNRKDITGPLWIDGELVKDTDFRAELKAIYKRWFEPKPLSPHERAELEKIRLQVAGRQRLLPELLNYFYCEVGASSKHVDQSIRKHAEQLVELLSIPWPIRIRWFTQEGTKAREYARRWGVRDWPFISSANRIAGQTKSYADEIWVQSGMDLWQTLSTTAHECKHIMQPYGMSYEKREKEARQFAERIIALCPG